MAAGIILIQHRASGVPYFVCGQTPSCLPIPEAIPSRLKEVHLWHGQQKDCRGEDVTEKAAIKIKFYGIGWYLNPSLG